ncbi:MAG: hypothetical protein RLZZ546_3252 [Bacteroidota bacterium]|jgi:ribonuclease Z
MTEFDVTILGTSSSQPAFGRWLSSHIVKYGVELFMIDCGEGTQMQLSKYKIKRNQISAIFITHLHGDHIYGLPGVITSFLHYNRQEPLFIYGPKGIESYIKNFLETSDCHLSYSLIIQEIDTTKHSLVYEYKNYLKVYTVPLNHRIATTGYVFREFIHNYKINPDKVKEYNLTIEEIKTLKSGQNVERLDGLILNFEDFCFPKNSSRSYAYLSDTCFHEEVIPLIEKVSLLYHETTYLKDMNKEAISRYHSTTEHASEIAKRAQVKKMIIGHYSSRYKFLEDFEAECRAVFPNTYLGIEGDVHVISE